MNSYLQIWSVFSFISMDFQETRLFKAELFDIQYI